VPGISFPTRTASHDGWELSRTLEGQLFFPSISYDQLTLFRFGDMEWKKSGVTAEPEVTTRVLNGEDYSYLILVTDGLHSLLSDQEIVDLARNASDPTRAAKTIVHFGEDLSADDNCTCVVIPLAGWGSVGGSDTTEDRREYRRKQIGSMSSRMQRM
jgi:protein phosphatase PTC6